VSIGPITRARAKKLKEALNGLVQNVWSKIDTVQPCDTTQVRSDLDFGVKCATVQVYNNNHNSQSDHWIGLKFYDKIQPPIKTISKPYQNQLKLHILSNGGEIALYVKCKLILISFASGFNLRFNFTVQTQLLVNYKKITLESIKTSYSVYWW
jgi:hypothetical protein